MPRRLRPLSSLVEAISRLPQTPPRAAFAPGIRGENGGRVEGGPSEAAPAGDGTSVLVYGPIGNSGRDEFEQMFGGGIAPEEVVAAIQRIRAGGRQPVVRMDSPGGSVFGAAAIASVVEETGARVHIDGLCVSAGILVLLGAEERTASPAARLMVHQASLTAHGTAAQLLEAAAVVADIDSIFVERLTAMTSLDEAAAKQALLESTWYSPAAAAAIGLIAAPSAEKGFPAGKSAGKSAEKKTAAPASSPRPAAAHRPPEAAPARTATPVPAAELTAAAALALRRAAQIRAAAAALR